MKRKKLDTIRSYYESNKKEGSAEYALLGWESQEAQYRRFGAFAAGIQLDGLSLLDVGCGTGSLYEYLACSGVKLESFTGVDILEDMIDIASSKNLDAEFLCHDIFISTPFEPQSFDVVYTSGIFNLNLGNNREFLLCAVERFLQLARSTVAFSLLHHRSTGKEDTYYYFDPEEVRVMLFKHFGHRISSIHIIDDYQENDFTVICSI